MIFLKNSKGMEKNNVLPENITLGLLMFKYHDHKL